MVVAAASDAGADAPPTTGANARGVAGLPATASRDVGLVGAPPSRAFRTGLAVGTRPKASAKGHAGTILGTVSARSRAAVTPPPVPRLGPTLGTASLVPNGATCTRLARTVVAFPTTRTARRAGTAVCVTASPLGPIRRTGSRRQIGKNPVIGAVLHKRRQSSTIHG